MVTWNKIRWKEWTKMQKFYWNLWFKNEKSMFEFNLLHDITQIKSKEKFEKVDK